MCFPLPSDHPCLSCVIYLINVSDRIYMRKACHGLTFSAKRKTIYLFICSFPCLEAKSGKEFQLTIAIPWRRKSKTSTVLGFQLTFPMKGGVLLTLTIP